jgi:hypothetical protein
MIVSPTRHRSDAVALMASPVSAVCPPTWYLTPRRPAARPSAGSRAISARTWPTAVALSGSVS